MDTYYVSTTGSDSTGNGSYDSPYATIEKIISVVVNDSIVNVKLFTGTYTITTTITLTQRFSFSPVSNGVTLTGPDTLFFLQKNTTFDHITLETTSVNAVIVTDRPKIWPLTESSIYPKLELTHCTILYVTYALIANCLFDINNCTFTRTNNSEESEIIKIYYLGDDFNISNNTFTETGSVKYFIKFTSLNDVEPDMYDITNSKISKIVSYINGNQVNYNGSLNSVFIYFDYFNKYTTTTTDYTLNSKLKCHIYDNVIDSSITGSKFIEYKLSDPNDLLMIDSNRIYNNTINNTNYGIIHISKIENNTNITIPSESLLRSVFKIYGNTIDTITIGPTGLTGSTGPTGPIGYAGPNGLVGPTGLIGPVGFTGHIGSTGPVGFTGPTGPQLTIYGPTGPAGISGISGRGGITGIMGSTGIQGTTGTLTSMNNLIDCMSDLTVRRVAIGPNSLRKNNNYSTAVGFYALQVGATTATQTVGDRCTAVGNYALQNNTSGSRNTAIGTYSLNSNTTGSVNTAIGCNSLRYITSGINNVAIGYNAGVLLENNSNLTTVNNSTYIGANTRAKVNNTGNENVVGYNAIGNGSNTFTIGNNEITNWYSCYASSITSYSDIRDKIVIDETVNGLDIISKLKPVKYIWNSRDKSKVGIKESGFIAQDIDNIQLNEFISLVDKSDIENLKIKRDNLIPLILKSLKELDNEYTELEKNINLI
jgi:hypothetical protein